MGTKLVLGFGSTANQVVVHQDTRSRISVVGFGGTVNQTVVHQS